MNRAIWTGPIRPLNERISGVQSGSPQHTPTGSPSTSANSTRCSLNVCLKAPKNSRYSSRVMAWNSHSSQKVSFCIEDSLRFVSGGPAARYPDCSPQLMGITRTWADLYSAGLPGQEFDVTGLPAGEYYIVILIDPTASYLEQSRSNNRAWSKIFLDPHAGTVTRTGTGS